MEHPETGGQETSDFLLGFCETIKFIQKFQRIKWILDPYHLGLAAWIPFCHLSSVNRILCFILGILVISQPQPIYILANFCLFWCLQLTSNPSSIMWCSKVYMTETILSNFSSPCPQLVPPLTFLWMHSFLFLLPHAVSHPYYHSHFYFSHFSIACCFLNCATFCTATSPYSLKNFHFTWEAFLW